MTKLQFRILYREFLFRTVDLELLSAHALGDSNKLLGRFAALLVFLSVLLTAPSLFLGGSSAPSLAGMITTWSLEHFLIATTMLVVGLFAVLSWDSTFPDRRDVLVLAPLPVRARTLFLAKVAAVATALSLTVALLHGLGGVLWPLALSMQSTAQTIPAFRYEPAIAPLDTAGLEALLNSELPPAMRPHMGVAIGIVKHGERRVLAYGTAKRDSIFQIGSLTKTFTGLMLTQMVAQGKVRLDEPVRELLPAGTVRRPGGPEITLLDLATHRSGLPPMPDNIDRNGVPNPGADYPAAALYAFLARQGVAKPANPPFLYSNLGFGLLGQALANRARMTYPELLDAQIANPLGLRDTVISLSPDQQDRMIEGYDVRQSRVPPWDLDALAGAGAIRATAGDMLNWLEAQLRADSPAVRASHELRAEVAPGMRIALAWIHNQDTGAYWHNGAISGYTSHAFFHPQDDYAAIVLVNQAPSVSTFADVAGQHIRERFAGDPATSLASVSIPGGGRLTLIRSFAAFWITMLGAGAFIFCCVLGVQGLAAQLLPRRLFLRASSLLQLTAFALVVSGYLLQPLVATPQNLMAAQRPGLLAWSPSFWFLGLLQQLNGSPALDPLARKAWVGLAIALSGTAIAYALSYLRTLRRIVEEPDIVPGIRGGTWLPRFGNALQTAIVQWSIRTLMRSRLHRVILAFYLGMGFAVMIVLVKASPAKDRLADAPIDPWGQVNTPLLAATIVMMGFWVIGTRIIFSMPLDLRANWIFRVTGMRRVDECLAGSRRSLLLLSAAPVWLVSAALCFWLWPWQAAAGHLAFLGLTALILVELCLHGFDKIPFTCSYLPGKSPVHLAVLGALALLQFIGFSVRYERQMLEDRGTLTAVLMGLLLVWACIRWLTAAHAKSDGSEVEFEESEVPAVQVLGLSR